MKRLCDATENDPRPLLPRTKVEFLGVVGVDGVVNAVVVVAGVVVVVGCLGKIKINQYGTLHCVL